MSGDEIKQRIEGLLGGEDVAPALEGLFSDAGAPAASAPVEAPAPPAGAAAPHPRRPRQGLRLFSGERLTLSVEATEVRLLIARGERVIRWGRMPLPPAVMRNGQVVQPEAFGQAVATLVEQARASRRQAFVSLDGQRSLARILSLPAVPARMLGDAVQRTAQRELPLPLEELYLAWEAIGDRSASRLQVFTVGVPREVLDSCLDGLNRAGVRPKAVDLKPLALARAVNRPDVLIVDVEAETTSLVLARGFVPVIVRSIALPGEAERPLAERAENVASEIQRTLDFYASSAAASHPSWSPAVCLTGALGGEEMICAHIGARWPLVEPSPPMPLPPELPVLPYLANIGLALKRAS